MADTADLKSAGEQSPCGFESHLGHFFRHMTPEDITKLLRVAEIALNADTQLELDLDESEIQRLKELLSEHFKQ